MKCISPRILIKSKMNVLWQQLPYRWSELRKKKNVLGNDTHRFREQMYTQYICLNERDPASKVIAKGTTIQQLK